MVLIRPETPADQAGIRLVNERAFGQPQEADLVDSLRRACPDLISLVAEFAGSLPGHILFSPAVISGPQGRVEGMALAPLAVLPAYQRQGIGSRLVEAGLEILRSRSCSFVIVLGYPAYYPRFGFEPASHYGISSQWPGLPDEVFMALVLDKARMAGVTGVARYRPEFDSLE